MDKYGVQEDDSKTASDKCPKCGSDLEDLGDGNVLRKCPKCGTEPFE